MKLAEGARVAGQKRKCKWLCSNNDIFPLKNSITKQSMFSEKDKFLSIEKFSESFLVDHVFSSSSGCIDKEILLGSGPGTGHVELSWEKQGFLRSTPTTLSDWPWLLLIDIAKQSLTGS